MNQLPRRQSLERAKQGGYEGLERFDSVRRSNEDYHSNWEGAEVLLMLEILIRRQEGVEIRSCQLQERAVSDALPAIAATVRTSCSGSSRLSGRGNDSSRRMRTRGQ